MALRFAFLLLLATSVLAASASLSECEVASYIPGYNNPVLPNPFVLNDGTPVTNDVQFACRQQQIAAVIQYYEAGYLPPRPEIVFATFSQDNTTAVFNVTAGFPNATATWSTTLTYPSGTPPAGGWPLVIGYDGFSIPVPDGIAQLTYIVDEIALQNDASSRGIGYFYDVYGTNATASAMTAWVWGLSRIIDALEKTPEANINLLKLAVTGCSRDGKGALMGGAFEPRILLTIPQESGSGGDTCWRLSHYELKSGDDVQDAVEIVTENVWFSLNFDNYVHNLSVLPYDHHLLAALVAPRPLISFENTDFEWLSPLSGYGCMSAAHTVYKALGIPDFHGFVQAGNHSHCYFPEDQYEYLYAFFDRFLLDEPNVNTSIFTTNYVFNGTYWNASDWINWETPNLSLL